MRYVAGIRGLAGACGVCLVSACVPPDYPEAGSPPDVSLPAPRIEPVAPILRQRDSEGRTEAAKAELDARGTDLRARADALRQAQP